MSLKKVFNALKDDGIVLPKLNKYLLTIGDDEDRNHGYNSPSGVSSCPRSLFYTRTGVKKDGAVDARTRRIFDNGHHVHDRLQTYLKAEGCLLLEETPVWDEDLLILGHCDGMLRLSKFSLAILEIKSINANAYAHLTTAKPEHQMQAQVYMYCLEKMRQKVQQGDFDEVKKDLLQKYADLMDGFVVGGKRFTKEEKILHKVEEMETALNILYTTPRPITKMSVVYENKNDQDLKEFVIDWDDALVDEIIEKYTFINKAVNTDTLPDRPEEATSKSCSTCRYCNFTYRCWK